ncbi:hypothetical protein XF_0951 [Xylella fastidiosa 9a5c]|uniref:Uncharacterized protein n=1 Tax=Xylella fastidiosa (strain 9a5c) TaxID=160492 RepID=Q9PES7_XYLFA|nr:hypothetical protein [Xylella fastidiosa]AAF83761.1 hypothetical protein XF_0951 [Xylella fastidiosa 9a5c]MDG5826020.1 hypothetical protein [Xylella fastidiosa subsp. pauca]
MSETRHSAQQAPATEAHVCGAFYPYDPSGLRHTPITPACVAQRNTAPRNLMRHNALHPKLKNSPYPKARNHRPNREPQF